MRKYLIKLPRSLCNNWLHWRRTWLQTCKSISLCLLKKSLTSWLLQIMSNSRTNSYQVSRKDSKSASPKVSTYWTCRDLQAGRPLSHFNNHSKVSRVLTRPTLQDHQSSPWISSDNNSKFRARSCTFWTSTRSLFDHEKVLTLPSLGKELSNNSNTNQSF